MVRIIFLMLSSILILSCQNTSRNSTGDKTDTIPSETIPEQAAQTITPPCQPGDSLILIDIYQHTHGNQWIRPWDLAAPVSAWDGITLDEEGYVKGILLSDNHLTGDLPETIQELRHMQRFDFSGNPVVADIYIAAGKIYDDMISYVHLTINQHQSNYEADQLKPEVTYVIWQGGADAYPGPEPEPESSLEYFSFGEQIILNQPLPVAREETDQKIDGVNGHFVSFSYNEGDAYVFSGFLSTLPVPLERQGYFLDNLKLLYEQRAEKGYALREGEEEMIYVDESSGHEGFSVYEHGIIYSDDSYYEGGGSSVSFPRDLFSVQEIYLFANAYLGGAFSEVLETNMPTESRNNQDQQPEYNTSEIVEFFPDGTLKSVELSFADSGLVEESFFRVTESTIEFGDFGGS